MPFHSSDTFMSSTRSIPAASTGTITAMPGLGVLSVTGPEARSFLQGQLSCDTVKMANGGWSWGGYLTPKGRLISTFLALGVSDEQIDLVMDKALVDITQTHLRKYLLRANVRLIVSDEPVAIALDCGFSQEDIFSVKLTRSMTLAVGAVAGHSKAADTFMHSLFAAQGMPWLCVELTEQLTAHMISLDLAGGVDFDKGCYVGQEILIRSHHRGAIKKRGYVLEGGGQRPANGDEIMSNLHLGQACGQVVYSATVADGFVAFASIRKDAASASVELADGRTVRAIAPPYGLIDSKFEK